MPDMPEDNDAEITLCPERGANEMMADRYGNESCEKCSHYPVCLILLRATLMISSLPDPVKEAFLEPKKLNRTFTSGKGVDLSRATQIGRICQIHSDLHKPQTNPSWTQPPAHGSPNRGKYQS